MFNELKKLIKHKRKTKKKMKNLWRKTIKDKRQIRWTSDIHFVHKTSFFNASFSPDWYFYKIFINDSRISSYTCFSFSFSSHTFMEEKMKIKILGRNHRRYCLSQATNDIEFEYLFEYLTLSQLTKFD